MGILERLFGTGESRSADTGIHFYVKSNYADEIIDVRVDPHHDLAEEYGGEDDAVSHYAAHREVIGQKDFRIITMHLVFDRNRAFTGDSVVEGGELVGRAEYDAWTSQRIAAQVADVDDGI